ncbi:hypothetical protein KSU19_22615 [Enterobacter quasiroggenkampii]|uniref:hypothetical protein n=1 Tax=Enterobacter quasiroggenkampii TaxID=2497436 RepID=UPI0021D064F0|nr:hypothetical protein [Enterobacter quasiroggenkampii]MCU6330443.1 hypothetical protein [Enterobacter quasiroggenkampii]
MSVETLVVVNFPYQENMIMFSSLASLKSRLAHYCYTPIPSDDNDELIQIFNINRHHCGTLHQECLERWLNHAESWRERFPEKPLSPHDNASLRLALEILSSHALNQSEVISTMTEGDFYSPGGLRHIRQLLASVVYGFAFRLAEIRIASAYEETEGSLFMLTESLRQIADSILADHRHLRPVERCRLDSVAMSLTVIQIRLDEWLRQPDKLLPDESVINELCAVSNAMKSLLLDIARIRGGCWQQ